MTEQLKRWITAWVDGELPSEQREAVEKMLRDSPDAQRFLQLLEGDALRLKALPRLTLPESFAGIILEQIRSQPRQPIAPKRVARRWRYAAIAAAVLVGLGLSWVASSMLRGPGHDRRPTHFAKDESPKGEGPVDVAHNVAPRGPGPDLTRIQSQLPSDESLRGLVARLASDWQAFADVTKAGASQLTGVIDVVATAAATDHPSLSRPDVLTSPAGVANPFKTVDARLPLFIDVTNFESAKALQRLREDSLNHIDLSCNDSWRAMDRFQAACRANGIRVLVDGEATRRLNAKLPALYMVYLENVAPEKVAAVIESLCGEEKRIEETRKGDPQIASIMVQPLDEEGRKQLAEVLGVPAASLPPLKPGKKNGALDPTRPISDETVKALQKAAAGQGGAKPVEGSTQPTAIVAIFQSRSRVPLSAEIRELLESRTARQPDAVTVVFLLRPGRG